MDDSRVVNPESLIADAPIKDSYGSVAYRSIRDAIKTGNLQAGDRLLSVRDLQQKFGLSYSATLRALHRLQKEGLVVSRPGVGTVVTDLGHDDRTTAEKTVHVISGVPEEHLRFFQPLLDSVEKESGVSSGWRSTFDQALSQDALAQAIAAVKSDVTLLIRPWIDGTKTPDIKTPAVIVDHCLTPKWPTPLPVDVVHADSLQGAILAGQYFRDVGCRTVAMIVRKLFPSFLAPTLGDRNTQAPKRFEGFQLGWGPLASEQIIYVEEDSAYCGAEAVDKILSMRPRPDGVFVAADQVAFGVCHGLLAHGVIPGTDMKVMGFDGQPSPFPEDPPLTSVRVPFKEMGRVAVELALRRVEKPDRPPLHVALSCALKMGATA